MAAAFAMAGTVTLAPQASADGLPAPVVSKMTVTADESFTVSGRGCFQPSGPMTGAPQITVVAGGGLVYQDVGPDGTWSVTLTVGDVHPQPIPVRATCLPRDYFQTTYPPQYYPSVTITLIGPAPTTWSPYMGPYPSPQGAPQPQRQSSAPRQSTAPRTATAPAISTPPVLSTAAAPSPEKSTALPATAASGCIVCARIASGAPLGAGWPVSLRYAGFQPNEQVNLVMHSTPLWLGSFRADASGVVTASVRIPDSAAGGAHTFVLIGSASGERVVPFRVTSAAAAGHDRPVGTTTPIVLAAAGAMVVLTLLVGGVLVHRRRDRAVVVAP